MIQITIDCFGHRNTQTAHFRKIEESPDDVREDTAGNTYIRYGTGANCVIHKIADDDGITRRWTFGAWADRESLTYTNGMQDTITITAEE